MYESLTYDKFLKLNEKELFTASLKKEGTTLALIGCKKYFEFHLDSNWADLDQFIQNNRHEFIFTAISYHLGEKIYPQLKKSSKLSHPLIRLVIPEQIFQLIPGNLNDSPSYPEQWSSKGEMVYQEAFSHIKRAISLGEVYETNLCWPFQGVVPKQDLLQMFLSIEEHRSRPFSVFYKWKEFHTLCFSPERFIAKKGSSLRSDPIKGTRPRGENKELDEALRLELENDVKERSENTMIVDLVRNDMSKLAKKNTVSVPELCKVYAYPHVHQMISQVTCEIKDEVEFSDILKALFPMGSMTGAPKLAAMQFIQKEEHFNRELYSGSLGYINGDDFDLNVVIRAWFTNDQSGLIHGAFGSAITILANAAEEWKEVLTKLNSIHG